ncbi:hypothetical protein, partial [Sphingomonas sp. 10B4]
MLEHRLLPYGFARDFLILASRDSTAVHAPVELSVSEKTSAAAIAEVGRKFGKVKLTLLAPELLNDLIAKAYAGSGGDAADVVGEVES